MAILLIICIGYLVVASLLIHGARKVGFRKLRKEEHFLDFVSGKTWLVDALDHFDRHQLDL